MPDDLKFYNPDGKIEMTNSLTKSIQISSKMHKKDDKLIKTNIR